VTLAAHEEELRRLALHDEDCIETMLAIHLKDDQACRLDPKTHALVRLGALVALGAAPVSYQWNVGVALDAGATADDIVGILIAVAPISGLARVILATPDVAVPIGYDLDAAFEELGADPPP
jgi:alkylhydroperoxidase/carboxymuconolactone decarboxylase family protein YurZ